MLSRSVLLRGIALCSLVLAGAARADHNDPVFCDHTNPVCQYPDKIGNKVDYIDIGETTQTANSPWNDPHGLFGEPGIFANTLDFDPSGFSASAAGGTFPDNVDLTDVQLLFTVDAHDGFFIEELVLTETGTFDLEDFSGDMATGATFAEVVATVIFEVVEINDVVIDPVQVTLNMIFTPSDGDWEFPTDDGDNDNQISGTWTGSLVFDLFDDLLQGEGLPDLATKVKVTLDNRLKATSEDGTVSFIDKKDADAFTITAIVPEPGTFAMLATGILGLVWSGRLGT